MVFRPFAYNEGKKGRPGPYKEWNTMELELDRTQLSGFETVLDTTLLHEETIEMIVPDACPDILRIVDTEGTVCLRAKEAQEGRAEVSGTARAAVLYLPDGAEGMRRLEVSVPFTCAADAAAVTGGCSVVAVPWVQSADTRSLNPRKVLVRINLAVCLQVYAPATDSLCSGVIGGKEDGVEQLVEDQNTYLAVCVQEKPFTFSDELSISGSRPEAEELLKHRLQLLCSESKVIGNKLIFKGEAALQLVYRAPGGGLHTAEYELPFSQIMEVSGAGEEARCAVEVVLTSAECTLVPGSEGRTVNVSLGLLAQAVVRESRGMSLLVDVYGTASDLAAETQSYTLRRLLDQGVKSQTVREILETGVLAREVCDAYAAVGSVTQSREGDRLTLSAEVRVTVVYQAEEEGIFAFTRQLTVPCPLELPEDCGCTCLCRCPGQVFATPTSGGLEVRFAVDFQYLALADRTATAVSAVRAEERQEDGEGERPSIVLRMAQPGERLWDIAKAYGTTIADIRSANELEEETAAGRLLLIPRKR